jgi:CelD/BcsL family acetyltransferase involved in cellulose biosynthesis
MRAERKLAQPARDESRASRAAAVIVEAPSEAIAREWDELATATGAPPFLRPGWILAWSEAFGSGTLGVYTVRRAGRLVAVMPLLARRRALASPTSWETPVFGPVGESREAVEALMHGILGMAAGRVDLRFLDPDRPGPSECIEQARAARLRVLTRTGMRSPYLALAAGWPPYERDRLSGNRRRELRRRLRRLQSLGELAWEVSDGSEGLDGLLSEGLRVEASGWKGERRTAILSRPSTERFYRKIARWAAERGWLRLAFLRLDGRALAFDLSFEDGGTHYLIKTGFEDAYRKYGPGLLLRREMLRRSFEQGGDTYEFLGDAMPWKLEWTDTCRDRLVVQTFASSAAGRLEWAAFAYGRPVVSRGINVLAKASRRGVG